MSKTIHCYAVGADGEWEAICLDLDIAVQGDSFPEVFESLNKAVALYLKTVMTLPEPKRDRLLTRAAPLSVRLSFFAHALRSLLSRREPDRYHHQFTMPLAA